MCRMSDLTTAQLFGMNAKAYRGLPVDAMDELKSNLENQQYKVKVNCSKNIRWVNSFELQPTQTTNTLQSATNNEQPEVNPTAEEDILDLTLPTTNTPASKGKKNSPITVQTSPANRDTRNSNNEEESFDFTLPTTSNTNNNNTSYISTVPEVIEYTTIAPEKTTKTKKRSLDTNVAGNNDVAQPAFQQTPDRNKPSSNTNSTTKKDTKKFKKN